MGSRWILFVGLCFCPLVFLSNAFAGQETNVILITLDTTRADRMGFLGSTSKLTPNLDALATQGVVFTGAYCQAPLTTTSHATILSGTYPQFHNVSRPPIPLPASLPYGPDIFHHAGYHTAAFVGSMMLQAKGGGAPGFDRGFDEYDAGFHNPGPGEDRYSSLERRADDVVNHALTWIEKQGKGPFFVWIHVFDPHAPYEPPEPFASRYKNAPYDGEIAYTDSAMGKLFDRLRADKLYDGALIAVMADHGEALGEHGEEGHGFFLYDPTVHVPLVIKMPANADAGKQIRTRVELADVMPTLLEAVGVSVPKEVQGKSLLPLIGQGDNGGKPEDWKAYAETDYPHGSFGWSPLRSLRTGKYLYVQAPRQELYDETSDPVEDHNLASASPAVAQALRSQLVTFRDRTASVPASPGELNPEEAAKIRALGYIPATGHGESDKVGGVDPKDKVEIFNAMTQVNYLMEDGKNDEAIAKLKGVVAKDPTLIAAYEALSNLYTRTGDTSSAIATLRKITELAPDMASVHYQLGTLLKNSRDLGAAQPELEKAAAAWPKVAELQYQLAEVYINTEQLDNAAKSAKQALKLKPGYFDADLLLGFLYVHENKPSEAIPYLQDASSAHPNSPRPHEYMAQAYDEMGVEGLANQEREMAQRLKQGAGH